jgi:hypothetical protein
MAIDIRIAQFFDLTTTDGTRHLYQNYFVNEVYTYAGQRYNFAPFRAEGSVSNNTGDNSIMQVLFPNVEFALRLLDAGNGNRLSRLVLTTVWLTATNAIAANGATQQEFLVGIGASLSETTIELRFRSAIDSVISGFPARSVTRQLVGPLPLNANVVLQ